MTGSGSEEQSHAQIDAGVDAASQEWRQGDVVLAYDGGPLFGYQAARRYPLTEPARSGAVEGQATEGTDGSEAEEGPLMPVDLEPEHGFVVISQTCDVVRSVRKRPMVSLALLETVDDAKTYERVRRGYMPRLVAPPGLADRLLVANLDHLLCVEKGVLAVVPEERRVQGRGTDAERRGFAAGLARYFSRHPFPDDFNAAIAPVAEQIVAKHSKDTDLGKLLRAIREVRVDPDAAAGKPQDGEVMLLLLYDDPAEIAEHAERTLAPVLARFAPTGDFRSLGYQLRAMGEISAAAYERSVPLDMEHLSQS